VITKDRIGEHTGAEWIVLRSEIEAIHGKHFDDAPWLQHYFEDRYWYQAGLQYDPKQLTVTERKNLQTIVAAQKKQRKLAISPGDMDLFQNGLLSESMLHGLGLYELRLLRNEIYARHGRLFHAPWLQDYFAGQPWYQPMEDFREPELTEIEKANVATIVKRENTIHEQLSTKPVSRGILEGLFVEDARKMRNEIYARHGKVFKEAWLQKYFGSLEWYKADPQFSEASLSDVEKRNVAAIIAYEKKATSAMSAIEG
jgi:hypothetical protein